MIKGVVRDAEDINLEAPTEKREVYLNGLPWETSSDAVRLALQAFGTPSDPIRIESMERLVHKKNPKIESGGWKVRMDLKSARRIPGMFYVCRLRTFSWYYGCENDRECIRCHEKGHEKRNCPYGDETKTRNYTKKVINNEKPQEGKPDKVTEPEPKQGPSGTPPRTPNESQVINNEKPQEGKPDKVTEPEPKQGPSRIPPWTPNESQEWKTAKKKGNPPPNPIPIPKIYLGKKLATSNAFEILSRDMEEQEAREASEHTHKQILTATPVGFLPPNEESKGMKRKKEKKTKKKRREKRKKEKSPSLRRRRTPPPQTS